MKYLIMPLVIVLTFPLFGQKINPLYKENLEYSDGKVIFSEVVEVDSLNATELYDRAEEWFTSNYVSANDVLQVRNRETGRLIGKGVYEYTIKDAIIVFEYDLHHTLKIETKDGRYRVIITDFIVAGNYNGIDYKHEFEKTVSDELVYKKNGKPNKMAATHKVKLIKWARTRIEEVKKSMTKPVDDW